MTYFADLGKYLLGVVCFPGVVSISSVDCGNSEGLKMLGDCCAIQSFFFFKLLNFLYWSILVPLVKNLPANAGDARNGFSPWVGKIP